MAGANSGCPCSIISKFEWTKIGIRPEHFPDPNIPAFWGEKGRRRRAVQCERAALSRQLRLLARRETVNPSARQCVGTYLTTWNGWSEQ